MGVWARPETLLTMKNRFFALAAGLCLAFVSSCANTSDHSRSVRGLHGWIGVNPGAGSHGSIRGLSFNPETGLLQGQLRSPYPQLPADKGVIVSLPKGESLRVPIAARHSSRRYKRPLRSNFRVQLPSN